MNTYRLFSLRLLIIVILGIGGLQAQSPYRFRQLSVNDGLTQNSIWSMCRDHNGYLWVGTADGLNRFNGQEVKTYKRLSGDKHSISGNNISLVFEDKYGHIWISNEGGLDIYDPVHDRFDAMYTYAGKSDLICRTSLILEEPNGEHLWFQICDRGITRFKTKEPTMEGPLKNPELSDISFQQEIISGSGNIDEMGYFSRGGEDLFAYEYKTGALKNYRFPGRKNGRFFCIKQHVYYFEEHKLFEFIPNTGTRKLITSIGEMNLVTKLIQLQNQLLLIDENGYALVQPETGSVIHYKGFMTDREETYYRLSSCLFDNEGVLWMGTDGRGIYYASIFANKFKLYRSEVDDENMVKGICQIDENHLGVAAYNKGLLVYNLQTGKHVTYKEDKTFPGAVNKKYTSVCKESRGDVWVSSTEDKTNRLYLVNLKTGIGKDYTYLINHIQKRKVPGMVNTWLVKNENKLYVVDRNLVFQIQKQNNQYISTVFYKSVGTNICFVYFSNNGQLVFIGTNDKTIVMNLQTKQLYNLAQNGTQTTKSVAEDHKGNYYVATTYGVYIYNNTLKPIKELTIENGLADNFNYGVLCDQRGEMWFSHNKGISKYLPDSNRFIHYDVKDGLQSNEFNTGAFCYGDGVLYFGGINGINAVTPESAFDNPNLPQVRITGIKLFDEPLQTDTQPDLVHHLQFNYYQNTLSFEFAALEFADFSNNNYSYIMEGYDKNWIQSGTKRFARYANLPPGLYVFKVKAANSDGVWNQEATSLEIEITPPFWQTIWFDVLIILLIFIVIAGIAYLFYNRQQLKIKREQEVQRKLDQERVRISRDLHDHVGAQLSYLVTNIEWMKSHPDQLTLDEETKRLAALEDAGRQAILTLRQTIWAISQHELSIEEFADRFKQYCMRFIEFSRVIQLHFEEEISTNSMLSPALALNIFRVCQESFNNAVKHSCCKNITVRFHSSKNVFFSFIIEDDGKGFDFDQASSNGHYGLHNMRARTEEYGATLTIETTINKGTKISIVLSENTSNAV